MKETIKDILIRRDGISEEHADVLVQEAKDDLDYRLSNPDEFDNIYEICSDHFGLEPDFLDELL